MMPPHGVWVTETTDTVALPQITVDKLIGSQAEFEIKTLIRILFHHILLYYRNTIQS